MAQHHSVGASTWLMTPSFSILSNFCFTFPTRGNGTRRGTRERFGIQFKFYSVGLLDQPMPIPELRICYPYCLLVYSVHFSYQFVLLKLASSVDPCADL